MPSSQRTTGWSNGTRVGEGPGRWRAGLAVAAILALAAAYRLLPFDGGLPIFLEWVRAQGALGMILLGGAYVVACVLLIPGTILSIAAGFLFGVGWGSITVSVGSTLGACAAFLTGRALAREWVARRLAANDRFAVISEAVARRGFVVVLLARLSPVLPFNLLNYAFGLTSIRFPHYAVASWLGMLPATVAIVYIGSGARSLAAAAAGDVERGRTAHILFWLGLAAALAVAAFVGALARRALRPLVEVSKNTDPEPEMEAEAP